MIIYQCKSTRCLYDFIQVFRNLYRKPAYRFNDYSIIKYATY